jgi:hypothetical protein
MIRIIVGWVLVVVLLIWSALLAMYHRQLVVRDRFLEQRRLAINHLLYVKKPSDRSP